MQQKRDDGQALLPGVQCRSCIHHTKTPHPQFGTRKTCDKMGILPSARAPEACFSSDVIAVIDTKHSLLQELRDFALETNPRMTQNLAYTILQIDRVAKAKLMFGQRVAFCLGADVLQNYFRGRVISVTADGEFVYVSSELQKGSDYTLLTLMRSSVLTFKQWQRKKQQLIRAGAITEARTRSDRPTLFEELQMPKSDWRAYRETLMSSPESYKPPSLDSVPQHWIDRRKLPALKEDVQQAIKFAARKSKTMADKKLKSKLVKAGANGKLIINRRA